jgi:predicted phage terminase large subunit-like protein
MISLSQEKQGITRDELEASVYRDSFWEFLKAFWDTIIAEEPHWNWHMEYLCDELQKVAERVEKRLPKEYDLIINISPGSTKSTIASIMFPAWLWGRMPDARVICGSYAHPLSLDLSRKCRDVILSDKYFRLFPDIILREDQNTKGYFANTCGGERYSVGTGGSVTGMHGHFIIVDDPIDPLRVASQTELDSANRWMDETLSTRKVDKSITPTILIMQRLHQDDPTGHILENRPNEVKHICLPAVYDPELDRPRGTDEDSFATRISVRPRSLRKRYKNQLMDPVRLSWDVCERSQRELGRFGYAGQMLQSPIPAGGRLFDISNLQLKSPPGRFRMCVRFWDKAGTSGAGAYSVGVLMAKDFDDKFWVLDVMRGQWNSAVREDIIRSTAEMDGAHVIVGVEQEPGSGGKESAEGTVRRLAGFRVRVDRPTGTKEARAEPYSVSVNNGDVYLARGEWNRSYVDELQYFPDSQFKDQVDASSGAYTILTKYRMRVGALPQASPKKTRRK